MMRTRIREEVEFALRRSFHRFHPWTALNNLDRKLLEYLPQQNGVFVEAGANDGIKQSNTYYFERCRGWTGLLVEPVPRLANRCRRARPGSTVVESLLVGPEQSGKRLPLLDLDLMTVVTDQRSVLADIERHADDAEIVQHIRRTPITALGTTLSALIERHISKPVDLLSLDVEGFEVEVLRGLDLNRHQPAWILVETAASEIVHQLLDPTYDLVEVVSHHDYLFRARTE